jgi:hypothetical protein
MPAIAEGGHDRIEWLLSSAPAWIAVAVLLAAIFYVLATWASRAATRSRIGAGKEDRELTAGERAELAQLVEEGFETIGNVVEFPEDPDDPAQVIKSVRQLVDAVRAGNAPSYLGDSERIAYAVGAVWGDVVQRTLGWHWVMLPAAQGGELLALVPNDRSCVIRPQLYVYRLLAEPASDNTAALLYNMLLDGRLPSRTPGAYATIG